MKEVWFDREIELMFERLVQLHTKFGTTVTALTFIEGSLHNLYMNRINIYDVSIILRK